MCLQALRVDHDLILIEEGVDARFAVDQCLTQRSSGHGQRPQEEPADAGGLYAGLGWNADGHLQTRAVGKSCADRVHIAVPLRHDLIIIALHEQLHRLDKAADVLFVDLHGAANAVVRAAVEIARGDQLAAAEDHARGLRTADLLTAAEHDEGRAVVEVFADIRLRRQLGRRIDDDGDTVRAAERRDLRQRDRATHGLGLGRVEKRRRALGDAVLDLLQKRR